MSAPAPSARDEGLARQLVAELAPLLRPPPVAANHRGLQGAREAIEVRLGRLGFTIAHHTLDGHPPVVVATRPGAKACWIGLSGHYDVEVGGPGWSTDPFVPVCRDGRVFARGVADNLGPLVLRLLALEAATSPLPSLVWLLHGEEEIGSPAAHQLYPTLALPPVSLWLEETGYFELDGRQRVLLRRPSEATWPWVEAALQRATATARAIDLHDRYLNKAFGVHRCPFLTHVVGDATYLALGPNDPASRIHGGDESLPVCNLALCVDQFRALLEAAA